MAKLRTLLAVLVFVLLIVSILTFEKQRREKNQQNASVINVPEFFLEQSLTTSYTNAGNIDYQMNSDYLEYFKQDDTAKIKQAYFIFYNANRLPWHSRSDQATLFNNSEEIQLSGNIKIWQPDRQMEITTDSLLLSDSRSIAETSDVIYLKSPSGNLKSKGMKADFNADKLQFFSDVTSEYYSSKENTVKKKAKTSKKKIPIKRDKNANP